MVYQKQPVGRFSEDYPPERRSIRMDMWPEADRRAWEHARRAGSAFELPGRAAHWAPETCRARQQAYGRYLNFLQRNGLLLSVETPAERLTLDRVALYLAEAKRLVSALTIDQILIDLRQVACALMPERDWGWIRRHPARPSQAEIRAGKKQKQVFDPGPLLCKALDFMDQLSVSPLTYEACLRYRDALIVAMQCGFALRRRNLVDFKLGRNLIIDGDVMHIIFRADETKNYSPIRWTVPDYLKPYMLTYLNECRPALLDGNVSDALWINGRHKPLQYGGLPTLFDSIGKLLLGYPITCHWFRHSMATAILTADPRKTHVAAGALSHRSRTTVNQHYDKSGDAASRLVWENLREEIVRGKGRYRP
jgi:integrase/recombinase XerD